MPIDLREDVPHVDIAAELIEQWFSDLYHGKRPGDWPDDATFSEAELTAITQFHDFYDERIERLPESRAQSALGLRIRLGERLWTHARRTLEQLPPNKSLEPTAAPLSGLARLPFRAAGSSRCGSALIR